MADLPKITSPSKIAVAGTYIAEQISNHSFELVNATFFEEQQSQTKQKIATFGKRRRPQRQEIAKCTVLPALNNIDSLLSNGVPKHLGILPAESSLRVREEQMRECRDEAVARLYHARPARHGLVSQMSQMGDKDAMAWLTRPPTGKPQKRAKELDAEAQAWSRTTELRKGKHTHETSHHLFQTSLKGTDFSASPMSTARSGGFLPKLPKSDIRTRVEEIGIEILPEDAVEAYFAKEAEILAGEAKLKKNSRLMREVHEAAEKAREMCGNVRRDPAPAEAKQETSWNGLLDAIIPSRAQEKLSYQRKEACESLRILVFGAVGNEDAKTPKEKEAPFLENIGSKEKVKMLFTLWKRLDDDGSGRVDCQEFRTHMMKTGQSTRLADKAMKELLGKKSSFAIEDMMKLLWPAATLPDMKLMKQMGAESMQNVRESRVMTPPMLPPEEFNGLCENFRFFDKDQSGSVSFEELIESGLLDKEQAEMYMKDWDDDGTGELTQLEFVQMLCPSGYRACAEALSASDADGNRVIFDELNQCWSLAEDLAKA